MLDQIDIDRAAFGLVKNHGRRAAYECSALIERWEKRGDPEASELWRSVLKAIRTKIGPAYETLSKWERPASPSAE